MQRFLTVLTSFVILPLLLSGSGRTAPPPNADPRLAPWFNSLRQPGTGVSCCSVADCRPVDYRATKNGYEVWINDHWIPVPPDKVLDGRDNPIGRAVVCYTPTLGVMCFVRGTEA